MWAMRYVFRSNLLWGTYQRPGLRTNCMLCGQGRLVRPPNDTRNSWPTIVVPFPPFSHAANDYDSRFPIPPRWPTTSYPTANWPWQSRGNLRVGIGDHLPPPHCPLTAHLRLFFFLRPIFARLDTAPSVIHLVVAGCPASTGSHLRIPPPPRNLIPHCQFLLRFALREGRCLYALHLSLKATHPPTYLPTRYRYHFCTSGCLYGCHFIR